MLNVLNKAENGSISGDQYTLSRSGSYSVRDYSHGFENKETPGGGRAKTFWGNDMGNRGNPSQTMSHVERGGFGESEDVSPGAKSQRNASSHLGTESSKDVRRVSQIGVRGKLYGKINGQTS